MLSGMDAPVRDSRFQSFIETGQPEMAAERLTLLRERMAEESIDAYLVARTDAWGNEYIRACDERLAWLTGFTGSAGVLIVTADIAALFVDGRYTLQAARQVDANVITVVALTDASPEEWLAERLQEGRVVSADAVTEAGRRRFARHGVTLHFGPDLVAEIWQDRPAAPNRPLFAQPEELTGKSAAAKLADIRRALAERQADAAFITSTDSVSWLFNIRGCDIPHTPVALAMALVPAAGRATLFVPDVAMAADVREPLADVATFAAMEEIEAHLKQLKGRTVLCDPARSAARYFDVLREAGATVVEGDDPCLLPKAVKTAAEQAGMRAAHIRDGVALTRFLAWLARAAADGSVDEIAAAVRLEDLRVDTARALGSELVDLSFDTISAAGEHGAIVHYRVTERSNRPLKPGELYLVDSGAQYRDGTTDVTRTVFIGPPDMEPHPDMKRHFTLVLKGMIALSMARFPDKTTGANLDVLARQYLWRAGLDYDHGTGHGVGAFLSVHEGPQSISRIGKAEIRPGMITSNEPGYYREGRYGIRIENLILCRDAERRDGEERAMRLFETLTLAPIERRLIDTGLLTTEELDWLNAYHAKVRETLRPLIEQTGDVETARWLEEVTVPLSFQEVHA